MTAIRAFEPRPRPGFLVRRASWRVAIIRRCSGSKPSTSSLSRPVRRLFYLPRIFVNLASVPADSHAERERLLLMARRLYRSPIC